MESDHQSLQYSSPSSSLPPPENPFESFLGSLVTLISKIDIRYEGILFHINPKDATLGLHNVICYGTEGRNGSQIPPIHEVFSYILFSGNHIKEMLVKPFTHCGYYYRFGLAKPSQAKKPPLPRILSLPSTTNCGKMIRHKIPLVKPHDSSPFDGRLMQIASNSLAQPQYSDLSFYDHWSYHGVPNQDTSNASELTVATNQPQSFFTTFPPAPISLQQNPYFGVMNQNFNKYEMWNQNPPPKEEDTKPTCSNIDESSTYNIDGSFYDISRLPFDPIGRPYNPYGSIARQPVKYTKEPSIDWSYDLKPSPFGWTQ